MSEEQEPFETLMRKMCDSVLRDMQPQVVEAEQAAKQARAELRDRFAGHALEGLLAADDAHAYNRDEMAAEAWRQADAIMKAREENSQ
jgi:hypothetical protein